MGWSRATVSTYESIKQPLTFALLPGRPHSRALYERWKDRSEFILHLPMEPKDYPRDDPGKLALMTSMSRKQVRRRAQRIISLYPDVTGVNNHMGSQFVRNKNLMEALMRVLSRKGLFFLDSRTSQESVAVQVARKMGVPVAKNQVFLDHNRTRESIRGQLEKLVTLAREDGSSVGIGHFQSTKTARVLKDVLPLYEEQGINFVPLSQLVNPSKRFFFSDGARRHGINHKNPNRSDAF